jgi:hypothetical protein
MPRAEDSSTQRDRIPQFRRWAHKGVLGHLRDQLMLIEGWRSLTLRSRVLLLSRFGMRIRDLSTADKSVWRLLAEAPRVELDSLAKPLSVLECLDPDARVLCVDPRSESELFNLAANGFKLENIRGLSRVSYSPLIELGDPAAMPLPDDSWDAAVGRASSQAVVRELIRVCRPGGVVAIRAETSPELDSVDSLLAPFRQNVDRVYFSQVANGTLNVIISVKKP